MTPIPEWLERIRGQIAPLDQAAIDQAQRRQNCLTKPPGSLGQLENLATHLAGIVGSAAEPSRQTLSRKAVLVAAGDHGVTAEGVSAYPASVTRQMVSNFLNGGAAVNVLARQVGVQVVVVDVGVAAELPPHPALWARKTRWGTGNFAQTAAMTRAEVLATIQAGADVVAELLAEGLDALALGEMGIGNTTAATALACVFLGQPPEELVGRGTGVDDNGVRRKVSAITKALALHQPDANDPVGVLAQVGGLEFAALAGAALAAAAARIPVFVDGFPATAAMLPAVALAPRLRDYLISGHRSAEPGHAAMLDRLRLKPLLDLGLRLGEGTGAVLALALADSACRLLREMATFTEAGVSDCTAISNED